MNLKPVIFLFLLFSLVMLFGQQPADTLIELPVVDVHAEQIFRKEAAGMRESRVDSLVFMRKQNLSLSELLSENTSLFVKSHGRGALATASFRGTAPSHTRVFWNGMEINSPMAGMVDFSLIPVYLLDDVRLGHGNASVAHGSGGIGGSISMVNRANWDNTFNLHYIQGIGSYRTWDEFLQVGAGNRTIQWRSRLYHNYSQNNYTFLNRSIADLVNGEIVHPVDTNNHADYTRYGTLQELYWQPARRHIVSLRWWSQHSSRSIPRVTSYEGPQNANINRQEDTDHRATAQWDWYTDKGKWTARTGFARKDLTYTLKNQISGAGMIPVIYSTGRQNSQFVKSGYDHQFSENFSVKGALRLDHHHVETLDTVSSLGYEQTRQDASALVAARYGAGDYLNINLMLRQDLTDGEPVPLIPYAGFDFRPYPALNLVLKANVAGNYNQPSLNDLYWQPGGNPDLLPEKGFTMETGLLYTTSALKPFESLQAEITAYRSDVSNWITWIPGFKGYWEPFNIKRVLARGLEVSAGAETNLGQLQIKTTGTYAYTRSENRGDPLVWGDESWGKQLVYIPLHSGNFLIQGSYMGFSLAWQHNSYSERFTTTSNDISRRDWLYPYFMNDLSLGYDFQWNRLATALEFKIYNLFDERYHSVLYRPMPGRNYMLILRIGVG